jgi:Sulfotransferase domain
MEEAGRAKKYTLQAEAPGRVEKIVHEAESADRSVADECELPSFFIIGPPRTGSSWLYEVLRSRTRLPGPSKETRFFDTHYHRGLKWYLAHYEPPSKDHAALRTGEVAPTYFASSLARERIAGVAPNAKIVVVFRNPVDRIVSLYRLKRAYGLIPWEFEQALERDPELIESGRYASHLRLWQRSFGSSNVMAALYDDLLENPQRFVNRLADFIRVPRFELADWEYGRVHDSESMTHPRSYHRARYATLVADWFKARRMDHWVNAFKKSRFRKLVLGGGPPFPKLSERALEQLSRILEPEVEELEEILRRDLSRWKMLKAA